MTSAYPYCEHDESDRLESLALDREEESLISIFQLSSCHRDSWCFLLFSFSIYRRKTNLPIALYRVKIVKDLNSSLKAIFLYQKVQVFTSDCDLRRVFCINLLTLHLVSLLLLKNYDYEHHLSILDIIGNVDNARHEAKQSQSALMHVAQLS